MVFIFQSTLPVGGATLLDSPLIGAQAFQSTLPVGGATTVPTLSDGWIRISIHAPRGGSDPRRLKSLITRSDFNPRSPWGERLMPVYGLIVCC